MEQKETIPKYFSNDNKTTNLNDLIGKEFCYRSDITKGKTVFKVKEVSVEASIIGKVLCFSVTLISENGNKYIYEEDNVQIL